MSFTVTARISARRFAYQHSSALGALDHGMSLAADGLLDVAITDGAGLARSPAALYRELFGPGQPAAERVAPAPQALAA